MSPAPTTPYARVQRKIFIQLEEFVQSESKGEVFFAPVDVYLNDKNIFQPDILFLNKDQLSLVKRKGVYGAPALVIEILSDGNHKYDLEEKKEIYEQCKVTEYWVIDPDSKLCRGFILMNDKYETLHETTGSFVIQMFNLTIQI